MLTRMQEEIFRRVWIARMLSVGKPEPVYFHLRSEDFYEAFGHEFARIDIPVVRIAFPIPLKIGLGEITSQTPVAHVVEVSCDRRHDLYIFDRGLPDWLMYLCPKSLKLEKPRPYESKTREEVELEEFNLKHWRTASGSVN